MKEKSFYHGTNLQGAQDIVQKAVNPAVFDEFSTYGPGFYAGNNHKVALAYSGFQANEGHSN